MDKSLKLEIVTPDRLVLSREVDYVGAPGLEGDFGVLPNHVPFLTSIKIGNVLYKEDGKSHYVFVAGGFAEVSNSKITILAEVAERAVEIDKDRANKARDRAEKLIAQKQNDMDMARGQAALRRAIMRIRTKDQASDAGTMKQMD